MSKRNGWLLGLSIGSLAASGAACADDWAFSGLLREEIAAKLDNNQNINNWAGNLYNGVAIPNTGLGAAATPTYRRPADQRADTDFNLFATRAELNLDGKVSDNLEAHFKLRGYSDQVGKVEDAFKSKNIFEQTYGDGKSGGTLGAAGKSWMVDLPNAYLDYSSGPLWLRLGNQQIAWGEALFFRVADMASGLDLRRHVIFDVASEEFSDKRVSALGLRSVWRFDEKSQLEGFVQQFRPSVLPGENAPYNIIPAQFIVDQKSGYDQVKDKFNVALRFQGNIDNVGVQAFALNRHNPDGIYRWTEAKGPGAIGGTPFSYGTGVGVYSAQEWFKTAQSARLDGLGALESAVNEFSATRPGGALASTLAAVAGGCKAPGAAPGAIRTTSASASCILDTFFDPVIGFGNLRGSLVREYQRESIFGFGLNTVFSGEPDSLTDQLIGRFELSYTPNKKFTNPTMSRDYITKDETNFALIFEKYHKFSDAVPATYMVLQWLHKSASDIFGRPLIGQNDIPGFRPTGQSGGSNYIALVAQQPSPSLEWRFDLAALTDTQGGWFLQPGVKWKPSKSLQLDVYANYLASSNKGKDFAEGFNYAREVFVRGTYYF